MTLGKQVERIGRWRRVLLIVSTLGWLVWESLNIAQDAGFAGKIGAAFEPIHKAGFVVWLVLFLVLMVMMWRAARDKHLRAALEDELTRDNRMRAYYTGYFALLWALIVFTAIAAFIPITALEALQGLIVIAVMVPIFRFVWLDSRGT